MTTATTTPTPNVLDTIVTDIEGFIQKVVTGVEHTIADVEAALSNAAQLVPGIAQEVEAVATFIEGTPLAANPTVAASVAAVDAIAKGVDAWAATWTQATTGGGITTSVAKQSIMDIYQTYQNTVAAAATAKAMAITAAQTPAGPAPTVTAS